MATMNLPVLADVPRVARPPRLISVEKYLNTTYRPDVDYVDGRIERRNVGEFDHADVQGAIGTFLRNRQAEWSIRVVPEVRVQVSELHYRVPDICVMPQRWTREKIVRHPPLLCVEVLSPRDRLKRMRLRVQEFLNMGVSAVWILDPVKRTAYVCQGEATTAHTSGTLGVEGTPIEVDIESIFATLDL
jgi:Uma2 family endonuclease